MLTQYCRQSGPLQISVGATTNSSKLLCFKFWHEIACQLSPSLLFPAQADSFGWLLFLLGQTWGSTAEQRHRICPIGVWWGLSQVMESKPSQSFSQREGQIRKNLGLWRILWWRMKTVFLSFCPTKWKEKSLQRSMNAKIPKIGSPGKVVPQLQEELGHHRSHAAEKKGGKQMLSTKDL